MQQRHRNLAYLIGNAPMKKISIAAWIAAPYVLLLSLNSYAGESRVSQFHEKVSVELQQGAVVVKIVFDNATDKKRFVPKWLASAKNLWNPVFEITTSTGESIPYIGAMAKRSAITDKDYVAIAPYSTLENTLDITDSYAFKHGTHSYRLSYEGIYLNDITRLEQSSTIGLVQATFTFSK